MSLRVTAIASLVVLPALLTAQAERITIRMAPAPNQTIHLRTTQEMVMTTDIAAPAGSTPPPGEPVTVSMVVESMSAVGPADPNGRYTAQMTIDRASATVSMNGKPMPLPNTLDDSLKPVITFSYDQDGKVLDVTTDAMPGGRGIDGVKQLMASAMQSVPPLTLSVGESVTVPTALSLPLAGGATAPAGFTAETRYTLTSVTFDGADRIAHLTTHMTNAIAREPDPAPAGSPSGLNISRSGMDMTTTGDGKSDVNIDRGIVLHSEQRLTIEGSMRAGAGPAPPAMAIHGTINIVSDIVK
jgi:hypothetical protein